MTSKLTNTMGKTNISIYQVIKTPFNDDIISIFSLSYQRHNVVCHESIMQRFHILSLINHKRTHQKWRSHGWVCLVARALRWHYVRHRRRGNSPGSTRPLWFIYLYTWHNGFGSQEKHEIKFDRRMVSIFVYIAIIHWFKSTVIVQDNGENKRVFICVWL